MFYHPLLSAAAHIGVRKQVHVLKRRPTDRLRIPLDFLPDPLALPPFCG
jgi:hypothetical protein